MAKIKVTVERINGYCNLPVQVGDYFYVDNSKLMVPEGKHVCIWALQSMMPVFPIFNVRNNLDKEHWVRKVDTFPALIQKGLCSISLRQLKIKRQKKENE